MERYKELFDELRERKQGAFIPFLVIGDPAPDVFLDLVGVLVANGADALELGIAYSDPVADGQTIQDASRRVLCNGTTVAEALSLVTKIRERYPRLPIGLLVYANIVHSIPQFESKCTAAGVDSVLIADLPVEEDGTDVFAFKTLKRVYIIPPNADRDLVGRVANASEGYIYVTSRSGVTGVDREASGEIDGHLIMLNEHQAAPPLLGFGISRPEHVGAAVRAGFAGVIVGSALVSLVAKYIKDVDTMKDRIGELVREMKQETQLTDIA